MVGLGGGFGKRWSVVAWGGATGVWNAASSNRFASVWGCFVRFCGPCTLVGNTGRFVMIEAQVRLRLNSGMLVVVASKFGVGVMTRIGTKVAFDLDSGRDRSESGEGYNW